MTRFETPSTPADASGSETMLERAHAIADAAALLTPLSHSATQLIALNASPSVRTADVARVISHDQVLAAALLREANSAASSSLDPISTVDTAVVRLGMARVMSLAVRLSLSKQLAGEVAAYGLAEGQLGLLSVVGAVGAELVRERSSVAIPPEVTTAALLRDIGVLVLAPFLDGPHRLLLDVVRESGTTLAEGERMVLDANHGEAGGLLCQTWRLPETVRLGVQYHHDPFECIDPIGHGVFLADTLAHLVAQRTGGTWSHSSPDEAAVVASAAAISFDLAGLDAAVDATIDRFESRATGLSLA